MVKNKVIVTFFGTLLVGFAVLCGCTGEGMGPSLTEKPGADSGKGVTPPDMGLSLSDKKDIGIAAEIPAVRNQSRQNASGPKIPSGAYSDAFPGIYFIWDSKSDNNGYLFVDRAIFNVYANFVLTTKESSEYWDFCIKPQDDQQTDEDGRYVFFLPRVSGKNNINMVFLTELVAGKAKDPGDPVDDPDDPIEGPVDNPIKGPVDDPDDPIDSWISPTGEYTLLRLGPYGLFREYHEGWVYASGLDDGLNTGRIEVSLYRMRPDGTEKQKILEGPGLDCYQHDGWFYYWKGDDIKSLYRMRLDGSEKMQYTGVYGYGSGITAFMIKDEWIYFTSRYDSENRYLYRVKTNGSGLNKLADNCADFIITQEYIFLRYGKIAESLQYDTKIIRYNLDGTGETVLIEDEMIRFIPAFADSGYLYYYVEDWQNFKGKELHRMKFDGTERQTVVRHSADDYFGYGVLKDGYIYYYKREIINSSAFSMSYYRIRPDGTDNVLLCDKVRLHVGFKIIGNYIYYHAPYTWDLKFSVLYRLSINGGSPEAVYMNSSESYTGYFVADNKLYIVER